MIARRVAAIAIVAAAVPLLVFTLSTMASAWLVPPIAYLSPVSPTADVERIALARSLAPGNAFLPFFEAQAHHDSMLSQWFTPQAETSFERAVAAATAATLLAPSNPAFWLIAGAIDLDGGRLAAESASKDVRLASGVDKLQTAVDLMPRAPISAQQGGLLMVASYRSLSPEQQSLALSWLRRAATGNSEYLNASLLALRTAVSANRYREIAHSIAPDTAPGQITLAANLASFALVSNNRDELLIASFDAYIRSAELLDLDVQVLARPVRRSVDGSDHAKRELRGRLEDLAARHPTRPEPSFALALQAATTGNGELRRQHLRAAMALATDSPAGLRVQILRESSTAWAQSGNLVAAADDLEEALALLPRDVDSTLAFAEVLNRLGRSDEALSQLEAATGLAPRRADVRGALARAHFDRAQHVEAINEWRVAMSIEGASAESLLGLARASAALGRQDAAAQYYSQLLQLDPSHAEGSSELRELLRER